MSLRKLWLTTLASLVLVAGAAVATPAQAQDTAAVAINTKDDSSIFKLAFSIRRVMNGVVDESNAAVAFASCDACQTVALSYQVVLVLTDPEIVSPENVALAINYECTLCETLASAYQYVLTTEGAVRLTPEANAAIAELRQRLQQLRNSDLTLEEIAAEADAFAQELFAVIDTGLVDGPSPETTEFMETPGSEPSPQEEETTAPQESPEPEETPEQSGSTPDDEATPEPEPSENDASPAPGPSSS